MTAIYRYIIFSKFANIVLHTDILTVFILKYYINMYLIDTPNPNAKKILVEHSYEIAIYINKDSQEVGGVAKQLLEVNGVESIFTGPGFLTLTKEENSDWNIINLSLIHI